MYKIGIDLGGTNIAVGIVTKDGKILAKKSVKTGSQRPFEEIVKDMAGCTLSLLDENNISLDNVSHIGVGAPGSIDTANGVIVYANNFKYGEHVPMASLLRNYIDKPVYIGNDANVAWRSNLRCCKRTEKRHNDYSWNGRWRRNRYRR